MLKKHLGSHYFKGKSKTIELGERDEPPVDATSHPLDFPGFLLCCSTVQFLYQDSSSLALNLLSFSAKRERIKKKKNSDCF